MDRPAHVTVDLNQMEPNNYNPNKMNERQYAAEMESIQHFGFIDPITLRVNEEGNYIIVDGEHRWRATKEIMRKVKEGSITLVEDAQYTDSKGWMHPSGRLLNRSEASPALAEVIETGAVPAFNLGRISQLDAKRLTVILNETRGTSSATDLADVLASIREGLGGGLEDLQIGLSYGANELDQLLSIANNDFGNLDDLTLKAIEEGSFLDDFAEGEDDEDEVALGETTQEEGVATAISEQEIEAALGEQLFQLSYPVNEAQRSIILRAIQVAKKKEEINNSIDALVAVAAFYTSQNQLEEVE